MKRTIVTVLAVLLVALSMAAPATADIKAYNAAVTSGDFKRAAVEAKAVWAAWDRQRPDTAVIAREFGYISYRGLDYAAAREYGEFLRDHGQSLPTPDDQPLTSAVLLAAANFGLKPDAKSRDRLFEALKKRETIPNADMQTLLAASALYAADWKKNDYRAASESAELAATFLARGGDAYAVQSLEVRGISAVAHFMRGRGKNDYVRVVDLHDAVVDALDVATTPDRQARLRDLKFMLQAWSNALEMYFDSSELTRRTFKARELKTPQHTLFPESTPREIRCLYDFDRGRIKYPTSALYRGLIGAVVLKLDIDNEGRISKPEVLASVPAEGFADEILENIGTAKFSRHKDAEPGCMMFSPSYVFTMRFYIE